ncbi:MAG: dihydroorotase [Bacteroidota bacterium]|nr:dihydroorotase [Bacteroidota bacterium]
MKVLIKNATILSPSSPFHGKIKNIFIENGFISKVCDDEDEADETINIKELHVSVGWMDCFANFCDPGQEYKETLESGASAAAAGGFTEVMLIPNTQPAVSNKSQVEYLLQKGRHLPVTIHPIAAITKNAEGKELSEMFDMFNYGAIAFSDGTAPVQSSGILQKALEYILAIDGTIIQLPDDKTIGTYGLMNEGEMSTKLGLQGKPALSEELMIARDIELVRYTNSKIHFTGISTEKSLQLIAEAKKEKLKVTCSVTPYHLFFCDEDIRDYETNLKVNPPLRTKKDRDALREGIKKGTIDFIASHHQPQDWDHKVCEFQYAKNGMETLESVYGASSICGVSTETFVKMQSENIRKIFNRPSPSIEAGQKANLTLFVPNEEYFFEEKDILSKSKNNAFINHQLRGKVIGIFNKDRLHLNK